MHRFYAPYMDALCWDHCFCSILLLCVVCRTRIGWRGSPPHLRGRYMTLVEVLGCSVLCCAVLCCTVLCCAVLCSAVFFVAIAIAVAVLCCDVMCCECDVM